MFLELSKVMNFSLEKDNYLESMENNVFGKKSQNGIKQTSTFLALLYSFDIKSDHFKVFKYFWSISDENEKVLFSLVYAVRNDYLLQESIPVVSKCRIGDKVEIEQIEKNIQQYHQHRFTPKTLRSVAQNIASSWKQAGFIVGKVKNIRSQPEITYKVVAFAMLLSYLDGNRGDFIFNSECIRALCLGESHLRDLAIEASQRDFLKYQFAGNVTAISFDQLISKIGLNAI